MRRLNAAFGATMMLCAAAGTASATPITLQTFDTDPALSPSQAPGTWYTDRYAPAGFESEVFEGDDRLKLSLSADDGRVDRSPSFDTAFYNTQGRSYDTPGALSMSVDMYIDDSFSSGRIGGLWGIGYDAPDLISANRTIFPIVEFNDGQFQAWDVINGGFVSMGTPTGFAYDTFVNIGISLDTATDMVTVFAGDTSLTFGASGTSFIGTGILQGINTEDGIDRDIYFDNFVASAAPAVIPLPAGLPLLLGGLAAFGLIRKARGA